ncbi:MAG: hypothetical protein OM95_15835 [Bdellovibrio sp. ArHS]|uniref:polyprenyl synthetase family protein n=1 Tax=Bdellovibrio sp. ArHS TaxID=1569284 RepID=UPI000582584A|nr:polyprenyl synthetase family protein [Bdellovibrio sp. ArHS]KHD87165.1 MAG: hypothetical protein OM95_15835 [Bdellovibrio sp. ArHS]
MNFLTETEIEFPRGSNLSDLLQLSNNAALDDLLEKSLMGPLQDLLSRPRKNLRSALVDLGFSVCVSRNYISSESVNAIAKDAMAILEILHTGSLVIDDIQDGSTERRGAPAVHVLYGLPVALNAGNWMYFLPFNIVSGMKISERARKALSEELQSILLRAHYGQALDVGTAFDSIPQYRIPEVSFASMELKTGALAELASKIGALACDADVNLVRALATFGKKIGVALQMHDDIGNVSAGTNLKKWVEDAQLKRVTFVIAMAAKVLSEQQFGDMCVIAGRSEKNYFEFREFLNKSGVLQSAKAEAESYMASAMDELQTRVSLNPEQRMILERLQQKLMKAYG